jgi:hypothetical protein
MKHFHKPTKCALAINLKTAKALGLDVPLHLQQRADVGLSLLHRMSLSYAVRSSLAFAWRAKAGRTATAKIVLIACRPSVGPSTPIDHALDATARM